MKRRGSSRVPDPPRKVRRTGTGVVVRAEPGPCQHHLSLALLPDDTLLHALDFLTIAEVLDLGTTCSRMQEMVQDDVAWRLRIHRDFNVVVLHHLKPALPQRPCIRAYASLRRVAEAFLAGRNPGRRLPCPFCKRSPQCELLRSTGYTCPNCRFQLRLLVQCAVCAQRVPLSQSGYCSLCSREMCEDCTVPSRRSMCQGCAMTGDAEWNTPSATSARTSSPPSLVSSPSSELGDDAGSVAAGPGQAAAGEGTPTVDIDSVMGDGITPLHDLEPDEGLHSLPSPRRAAALNSARELEELPATRPRPNASVTMDALYGTPKDSPAAPASPSRVTQHVPLASGNDTRRGGRGGRRRRYRRRPTPRRSRGQAIPSGSSSGPPLLSALGSRGAALHPAGRTPSMVTPHQGMQWIRTPPLLTRRRLRALSAFEDESRSWWQRVPVVGGLLAQWMGRE